MENQDQKQSVDSISFQATFYRAATTIDGGLRISLDIPSHQAQVFVELMKVQKRVLEVAVIPHPPEPRCGF